MWEAKREQTVVEPLNAIVIDIVEGMPVGRKYHNVRNNQRSIERFCNSMKRVFPKATHANFYDKDGLFVKQVRF
jgi:hypothetical protein